MKIPIENIYYLLCYAWNKLDEKDRIKVDAAGLTSQVDLFAKVLVNAVKVLLKRGIDKNYIDHTEEYLGVKGKIDPGTTVKRSLLLKQKTVCTFDEFSSDILINRIVAGTLFRLLNTKHLDGSLRKELRGVLRFFSGVCIGDVTTSMFKAVRLHRNNRFYEFILHVCRIILECTLPSEQPGVYTFSDVTRDENRMNQLFEAFIRNLYRIEQLVFTSVKKEIIYWQFESLDWEGMKFLPRMETDITLENEERKIIIDAKYYTKTMGIHYEKERIHSGNMYQLFSYLIHQETQDPKTRSAEGILLYPTIDKEYDLTYRYYDHILSIKTVNLDTDWRGIHQRLLEIIE